MTEYDNTNRGVLFKNTRKESEKHPDYTGSINVDGKELWLSAWIKTGRNGKFMSLSVKPKDEQRQGIPAARTDGRTVTARRSSAEIGREDGEEAPF